MSNRRVVSRAAKSAAVFVLAGFTAACGGSEPAPAPAATAPAAPVDPARAAIEKKDVAAVKEQIEGLTRTHRMFKGVVAKT